MLGRNYNESPAGYGALRQVVLTAALVSFAFLSSCTRSHFLESADRETSQIIKHKGAAVPNMERDFTIDAPQPPSLAHFPKSRKTYEYLGDAAAVEMGATIVILADALSLAVHHNREYLQRKEALYTQALDLTLARHEFTPILGAGGSATFGETRTAVGNNLNSIVVDRTFTARASAGVGWLLKTGGRISSDLTVDFLRFVNGDLRTISGSSLVTTLSQPLLRGAGTLTVTETLTQAERDLLYSLRNFARFRKDFVVRIASKYYQLIQARDAAQNNWLGYQSLQLSVKRERALVDEDRAKQSELGKLRQAALRSELAWINAIQNYLQRLDEFKIELGLSIDSRIVLDDDELKKLKIINPSLSREDAARVALNTRLDLKNFRDRNEDTARRIEVFARDLLPGVDFVSSVKVGTNSVNGDLEPRLNDWSASLKLDLDPDKKQERNAFRQSLIAHQRSGRDLSLEADRVKLQVYNDIRDLEQARRQYEISEHGVELAERRLEEQQLLMELGRGDARDLVESQNDLVDSQNDLTGALVNHTISRLSFWRDMGILFINADGSWVKKLKQEGR